MITLCWKPQSIIYEALPLGMMSSIYYTGLYGFCKCRLYTNKNEVAVEFSKRREHELSTPRTFVVLILSGYKKGKTKKAIVIINSVSLV